MSIALCDMMEVLANAMAVIILLYVSASNQYIVPVMYYIVHNVACQLYLNKVGKKSI